MLQLVDLYLRIYARCANWRNLCDTPGKSGGFGSAGSPRGRQILNDRL